jgi:rhodanese-related sulfurtransferase
MIARWRIGDTTGNTYFRMTGLGKNPRLFKDLAAYTPRLCASDFFVLDALARAAYSAGSYLTLCPAMHRLIRTLAVVCLSAASALCCLHANANGHEAVSADAAALALAHGATVVDVRSAQAYAQGHLPSAALLPQDAARLSVAKLERLLSDAGIDLSRTVLVVGEPGDANAQALWQTLSAYATGRVLWLVGGATEWQMTGRALSTQVAAVKAVPQHLVALQAEPVHTRMAGHLLRASTALGSTVSVNATGR